MTEKETPTIRRITGGNADGNTVEVEFDGHRFRIRVKPDTGEIRFIVCDHHVKILDFRHRYNMASTDKASLVGVMPEEES